ncbi:hypothetical protein ACTMU2_26180 [Cupriavidus basilensis]
MNGGPSPAQIIVPCRHCGSPPDDRNLEPEPVELINHTRASLIEYVCAQIATFFPDRAEIKPAITRNFGEAMGRVERCFNANRIWPQGKFNTLHSAQYCLFLYYLANTIWRNEEDAGSATRLFLLNKALNGIDMFYEIQMPDIFVLGHSRRDRARKGHL